MKIYIKCHICILKKIYFRYINKIGSQLRVNVIIEK